jgi:hypothetical protein
VYNNRRLDELEPSDIDRAMPHAMADGMTRLHLRVQRRSPEPIARLAASYFDAADAGSPAPKTPELRFVEAATPGRIVAALGAEVAHLLREEAAPKDIAVLSLAGRTHARTTGLEKLGQAFAVRAADARAGDTLVTDTFLRFRGLERPFILVTDLQGDCVRPLVNADVRMHIALTRATLGVTIVGTAGALRREARLGAMLP